MEDHFINQKTNMDNKFQFTHQEAVKYVKTMLASFGITEYEFWEKSYDVEDEYFYGSKSHYDHAKFYGLPAPFEIGHIMIIVLNGSISLRLTMDQEIELDEEQQKLYKTKTMKSLDEVWVIKLPNYSISDRNVNRRSGYNFGNYINEKTIVEFNNLFATIFGGNYDTNHLVKLAAKSYEQNRKFHDFVELAAHAWNMRKELWKCVNNFSTQWNEIDAIWLHNKYEDLKWYD